VVVLLEVEAFHQVDSPVVLEDLVEVASAAGVPVEVGKTIL
jgi:hypothetical protein